MDQVNIQEAKTHLSQLVERAALGEPIIIAKAGKPLVVMSPYTGLESLPPRKPGAMAGEIFISADFDAPDPELESLFSDGPIEPHGKRA